MRRVHASLPAATSLLLSALLPACTPSARLLEPPREAPPAASVDDEPPPPWLLETANSAGRAGAGQAQIFARGSGIPGDSLSGLVNVPSGRCALLYARGSAGLEDLDLLVFGEDGSEFGSDEAADANPTLLLCPETEQRLYVSARVVQGRGLLALAVHDVAPSESEAVRRAVTRGPKSLASGADSWPGLEAAVSTHRRQIGGDWLDLRRVAVPVDARVPTRLSAEIPAERCLDALVLPSDAVARLDLDALDDTGRIFARGEGRAEARWTVLCAGEQKTTVSFEVRPQAGRGLALFVLSTSRRTRERLSLTPGLFPQGAPPRALSAAGSIPQTSVAKGERLDLKVGSVQSLALRFEGCARLDLTPRDPLLGYEARVWSKSGQLLAQVEAVAHAPLFVCASAAGARLDLVALRRGGGLEVQVGKSQTAPSEMQALPLAASRLLSRLRMTRGFELQTAAIDLHRIELSREQLLRIELDVPRTRCLQIFVGVEAGGYGVEIRALDAKSGAELASDRGSDSGVINVCAERKASRPIVVELRAAQGKAGALWTTRATDLE